MPITYQINETAGRVTLRFLGTVTDAELMYELLREGSPERVSVFRDISEAEQWLGRL